ncbi:MAG TPA: glutamine--fructose-6-phosphate transaminase (isomerizing) [Burkholderiaceae bacterium]|nr:glutamine--fructose-6-phosphate transaminase (isomerizing) [Burkholderiaceae bacterium]
MCGIVGAVARRDVSPVLTAGLARLEYRGYDSCGVALYRDGVITSSRSSARVADLERQIAEARLGGFTGIAHTRWATHGAPSTANAHPQLSPRPDQPRIALVHNGIIENHDELRGELRARGYHFSSQTDTEVVAHLIDHCYDGDLFEAVQQAVRRLRGAYAIAALCRDEPHQVVGARSGSPLVVGIGDGEYFLASDALALAGVTERVAYLQDGDVAAIQLSGWRVRSADGRPVERPVSTVRLASGQVELGPYRHFMQKEIFEQPRAIADTLEGVEGIVPELFGDGAYRVFREIDSVMVLACGTSHYAGLVARYWIELLAKVPVQVEIASEYRYRPSVPNPRTLVVTVSQSGETADTLAALAHAASLGMTHTLTICNVATSAMVRASKLAYITRAGIEIGVASTKAFTTQLAALFLLALSIGQTRGTLTDDEAAGHLKSMRHLPSAIQAALALEPQLIAWAERFAAREHALFLGRGLHYPIAMEGALKLKEISYIHAEAYAAGELKHGPLALVTGAMPVLVVAPNDALLEKLESNMHEVRARGGQLFVLADGDIRMSRTSDEVFVIRLPEHYGLLSPIVMTVPLQLLAYHAAIVRGTDIDKPRNLAKSVTVE